MERLLPARSIISSSSTPITPNADELDKKAKDAGFDDWGKYFVDRNDYQNNPDLPTMTPWMLVTKGSGAPQLIVRAQSLLLGRRYRRQPAALHRHLRHQYR